MADWFEERHRGFATGLPRIGFYVGIGLGLVLPALMERVLGFDGFLKAVVLATIAASVLFWVGVPRVSRTNVRTATDKSRRRVHSPQLIFLYVLSIPLVGFFNGFLTWLVPLFEPLDVHNVEAGYLAGQLYLRRNRWFGCDTSVC